MVARWRSISVRLGTVLGVGFAVVAWLGLAPWDLSTQGDELRSGDDSGAAIVAVGVAITVVALTLALVARTRALGAPFAAGGLWCWTALFAWRAGTAEVVGANMFLAPVMVMFVPSAVLVPRLVDAVRQRLDRHAQQAG